MYKRQPDCLGGLDVPDAIFIGGGLSDAQMLETCLDHLRLGGRLVANAVTHESTKILFDAYDKYGGELAQLSVARTISVGKFSGWKPNMPVVQWSFQKIGDVSE